MKRILLNDDDWLVAAGLLWGVFVTFKPRGIKVKANRVERIHLLETLSILEKSGAKIEPGNESVEDILRLFAEAVVDRGGVRWQAYFSMSPEQIASNLT